MYPTPGLNPDPMSSGTCDHLSLCLLLLQMMSLLAAPPWGTWQRPPELCSSSDIVSLRLLQEAALPAAAPCSTPQSFILPYKTRAHLLTAILTCRG